MKYKNKKIDLVAGMLYVVDLKLKPKNTDEYIRHKLLLVGCELNDIKQKLKWIFDITLYDHFCIKKVTKVREKVHVLSTTITQINDEIPIIVKEGKETKQIHQGKTTIEKYDPKLFAVGLTTTIIAKDECHAFRKIGNILIAKQSEIKSTSSANFSENSQLTIEEIAFSSGYADPKNVGSEINSATFVRG